jgi:hypothetical protein
MAAHAARKCKKCMVSFKSVASHSIISMDKIKRQRRVCDDIIKLETEEKLFKVILRVER